LVKIASRRTTATGRLNSTVGEQSADIGEEEALARLLALNLERAAAGR
jgi:hypothetical protein